MKPYQLTAALCLAALTACGGGGAAAGGAAAPAPPATLALAAATTDVNDGASGLTLSATHQGGSGTVSWSLASGAVGALDTASGDSVTYLPPALGSLSADASVTVNATFAGVTQALKLSVHKAAPGMSFFVGSRADYGRSDGAAGEARLAFQPGWTHFAADRAGNLYVPDSYGLRKISADGRVTTISAGDVVYPVLNGANYMFRAPNPSLRSPVVTSTGRVYVLDYSAIRSMNADGSDVTFLNNLVGARSMAIDAHDQMYVATNTRIYRMDALGQVTDVAGAASAGLTDGTGSAARFTRIYSMTADGAGNLYVIDRTSSGYYVRRITPNDMRVTTLAGGASFTDADGNGDAARFKTAYDLVAAPSGELFIVQADKVRRARLAANDRLEVGTLSFNGALQPRFMSAIGVNDQGQLFVTDIAGVLRLETDNSLRAYAGTPASYGEADGRGDAARFHLLYYGGVLASDPQRAGGLYVADTDACTVRRVSPNGQVTTVAGSANQCGNVDGAAGTARLGRLQGVYADPDGTLYLSDDGNATIRRIAPDGTVSTLAGVAGQTGSADGPAAQATFTHPHGLRKDAQGNLVVIDIAGSETRIRVIAPSGAVSTRASFDGYTESFVLDKRGYLYAVDGQQLIAVSPAGAVIQYPPPNPYETNWIDGGSTRAQGISPVGIAIDADDNLYVSDYGLLRKINTLGTVTTIGGTITSAGWKGDAPLTGSFPIAWGMTFVGPKVLAVATLDGIIRVVLP